ncbi:MAG: hypothetical protein KKF46_00590 [Nanoarchaeota archaeon]|nr:hypothetical protein [Nanoarchaeota archaeon]MBU1320832.1 hypothetical protein [Nanoarchaeota archaeon]MBU1596842.1 hypothetical protein [Nanoarchaeota archaeon]MBU2440910.1 hypothetical protein [Nanoarchaeota archaeon]
MEPTKEYSERTSLVHKVLEDTELGNVSYKWESIKSDAPPLTKLPDHIAFYDGEKKVGEWYFTQGNMRIRAIDKSFKPYIPILTANMRKHHLTSAIDITDLFKWFK